MRNAGDLFDEVRAVGCERDEAVAKQFVFFRQVIRERTCHERSVGGLLANQGAVNEVAEFMPERRTDCARMMRGVDENYELAFVADVGAAVKPAQRQAGAGAIWLGAQFEFARSAQVAKMTQQLPAAELRQVAVGAEMLLYVFLDDLRQFL